MNLTSGKPEVVDKKWTHKAFTLGILLGMEKKQMLRGLNMFLKISHNPYWTSIRGNDALLIDCMYEVSRKEGLGHSQNDFISITRNAFGKGTQPKPHLWREFYEKIIRT